MDLNLKKPVLSLKKPTLILNSRPAVNPNKKEPQPDGTLKDVMRPLATTKMKAMASKMS